MSSEGGPSRVGFEEEEEVPFMVWSQPQLPGLPPSQRGGHSATVAGNHMFVFGGQESGEGGSFIYNNDVIVLDLEQWTWYNHKVRGLIPPPRYGHTINLLGNKLLLLFGRGKEQKLFRREVHFLDPFTLTWFETQILGKVPPGRFNHTATLVGSELFVFGGHNGQRTMNDMHVLDVQTWTWQQPEIDGKPPGTRHGHTATAHGTNIIVFGGCDDNGRKQTFLNDMRIFDTESYTWSRPYVSGSPPNPRYKHTATLLQNQILVFGGFSGTSRCPLCGAMNYGGDNATHDPECVVGLSQERVKQQRAASSQGGGSPPSRSSKVMSRGSPGSRPTTRTTTSFEADLMKAMPLDYFHALDLDTMEWSQPQVAGLIPNPRYGHSTNLSPHGLVVFGGWDGRAALDELLVLHIDAM